MFAVSINVECHAVSSLLFLAVDVVCQAEIVDKQALSVDGQYQLDVDVNTVVFWHHHLFSQEHVQASQITRLYEEYVSRMRKKTVEFLTGKVSNADQHKFYLFLC